MPAIKLHTLSEEQLLATFIKVSVATGDDFLKIRETLTRMGVANKQRDTLYQSCHILHKRGIYYIVSFKELFALDGREVEMSEEDYARRNTIAQNLEKWGMATILNPEVSSSPILGGRSGLTIIPHSEKGKWKILAKYKIGRK